MKLHAFRMHTNESGIRPLFRSYGNNLYIFLNRRYRLDFSYGLGVLQIRQHTSRQIVNQGTVLYDVRRHDFCSFVHIHLGWQT